MRYRNKRTGLCFETSSVISGPDFELIPDRTPKEVKETKPKTTTTAKRAKK